MNTPLTLESMRADIARVLHEDPSEIGNDDNLMDLGLDSMRTMTLASQWRDVGVNIDFSEMALNATLGHWWSLAESAQQG
ncbi:phosphopantetheine-binding protein [Pollutimonas harenae]|uniref:Phosphopantetheine-binding protein n=1 Tax=Pollutimonas harenae TaxID=657015 RepID=A0A853GV33_9BURK|nr:phosphopantetheine-binding protein [Pollutimonas harenae]NYT86161.1 phosphopantetheine-binding protein [Pollutimonas harenae]TEA71198.1 phosphopantetheine-binding protein [Pollutimonas harenae]